MPAETDTLAAVGERAALARILPLLPAGAATLVGPGDDCAVLATPDARVVITTDTMLEGADFRLAWSTWRDLGVKAAATNLSDVAAMGARPTGLVVALAVPASTPVAALEEFARGLSEAVGALAPGCGVVGGDLSTSRDVVIAVTAFGDLEGRPPVLRSGARVGDLVVMAGRLGLAGRGLGLLFREASVDGVADAEAGARVRSAHPRAVDAQLAPMPPIHAGVALAIAGATAMLDVSDGLVLDASRIAEASGVRLDLHRAALEQEPVPSGQEPVLSGQEPVLSGQEPVLSGQEPVLSGQEPVLSGQEPVLSGQEPVLSGQEPAQSWQEPVPSGQEPVQPGREPMLSGQEPVPSGQESVPLDDVLFGGEDHGLLATLPAGATVPAGVRVLGEVVAGSGVTLDGEPLEPRGWDPYRA